MAEALRRIDQDCPFCLGTGFVCEDHPGMAWGGIVGDESDPTPGACYCGAAGMPCREGKIAFAKPGGHGHVVPREDAVKASCGGPPGCPGCRVEEICLAQRVDLDDLARRALAASRTESLWRITPQECRVLWDVFRVSPDAFDASLMRAGAFGYRHEVDLRVVVELSRERKARAESQSLD